MDEDTEDNFVDIHYSYFVIDDEPWCMWDYDPRNTTLSFLEGIDPSYFGFLAEVYSEALSGEHKQHAALAIRTSWMQALETLFALLGSIIQAPHCVPAWLAKYRNEQLKNLVRKIQFQGPILSVLDEPVLSWRSISIYLHQGLILSDKDKESRIKKGFGRLWGRLASRYLDEAVQQEYNSAKHGLRVRQGGFHLAGALEDTPGTSPPPEQMLLLAQRQYGSTFPRVERVGEDKRNIRLYNHRLNWDPVNMAKSLMMISASITNIISCLKLQYGLPGTDVMFYSPTNEEVYHLNDRTGLIDSLVIGKDIIPTYVTEPWPKETILSQYEARNFGGIRRTNIS
jgi:hypothetical protein